MFPVRAGEIKTRVEADAIKNKWDAKQTKKILAEALKRWIFARTCFDVRTTANVPEVANLSNYQIFLDAEPLPQLLIPDTTDEATLVKPGQDAFWGGHSGYFSDPDGHLWEIAWNPYLEIAPDGSIKL